MVTLSSAWDLLTVLKDSDTSSCCLPKCLQSEGLGVFSSRTNGVALFLRVLSSNSTATVLPVEKGEEVPRVLEPRQFWGSALTHSRLGKYNFSPFKVRQVQI